MQEENKLTESSYVEKPLVIVDDNYDMRIVLDALDEKDAQQVIQLRRELADNWNKRQVFRTETEMRISVLNDFRHPTPASKYWQSVREMGAHFDALMSLTFDMRKNKVERLKLEKKMEKAITDNDELEVMEIQIELDQNLYSRAHMEQVAHDRVRELQLWSKIKSELDDGSFDTRDVNTHQAESYYHTLTNRVNSLGSHSAPAEVMNALGPFKTVERLKTEDGKLLTFDQTNTNKQLKQTWTK